MKFLNTVYFKIFAIIFILALLWLETFVQHNKDFDIFVGAAELIFNKESCYEVWIRCDIAGLKYFYSPLFAVLLYPLKDLPQFVYNLIWISFNFLLIYRIFVLLSFYLRVNKLSLFKKHWFYLLIIICTARSIIDNLALGQMTFLMVWGSLEAMRLIFERKLILGTALLALIINFKILPIALVTYLIYKREFRAVFLTAVFFIIYLYIPVFFIGYNFNDELLHQWFSSLTNAHTGSIYEDVGRPSLSSLIPSLLMDMEIQFSLKRNFVNLDEHTVNLILNGARVLFLGVLMLLFGKPFKKMISKKLVFYDLSLICLATPLIFPHQGKYSIFYLMPAYAYCFYFLIKLHSVKNSNQFKKVYRGVLVFTTASFVLVTLTTDGLIGRGLSDFTEYLHFITYGAFCLMVCMIYLRPKRD